MVNPKEIIFMDGGSGAKNPISRDMIQEVNKCIDLPIIIAAALTLAKKQ